jgi:hypothetical protein
VTKTAAQKRIEELQSKLMSPEVFMEKITDTTMSQTEFRDLVAEQRRLETELLNLRGWQPSYADNPKAMAVLEAESNDALVEMARAGNYLAGEPEPAPTTEIDTEALSAAIAAAQSPAELAAVMESVGLRSYS